jgi:hypothetical protein
MNIYLFISADSEPKIYFNYELDTTSCLTPVTGYSIQDCLKLYENNLETTNVMVYKRRFLLCQLCFVTKEPMKTKTPGCILAHQQINGKMQNYLLTVSFLFFSITNKNKKYK